MATSTSFRPKRTKGSARARQARRSWRLDAIHDEDEDDVAKQDANSFQDAPFFGPRSLPSSNGPDEPKDGAVDQQDVEEAPEAI